MRLFVAVDVDRATRDAARRLRERLHRERPTVDRALRWVDPSNLHLTMQFLGEREDAAAIEQAVSAPFEVPRFRLAWGTPAWLPPRGRPRVFYVAVTEGVASLARLVEAVGQRLAGLSTRPDERPFTPHLTLARVRDGADPGVLRQLGSLVEPVPFAPDAAFGVDAVVLYESRLSPHGPEYRPVCRAALA